METRRRSARLSCRIRFITSRSSPCSRIAVQVMANDVAVGFGGAGGYLEMNVYKPLIIFNVTHSITIMTDGCTQLPEIPDRGDEAEFEKDQGIRGPFPDAGDCSLARHWLRQIVEDCALRAR